MPHVDTGCCHVVACICGFLMISFLIKKNRLEFTSHRERVSTSTIYVINWECIRIISSSDLHHMIHNHIGNLLEFWGDSSIMCILSDSHEDQHTNLCTCHAARAFSRTLCCLYALTDLGSAAYKWFLTTSLIPFTQSFMLWAWSSSYSFQQSNFCKLCAKILFWAKLCVLMAILLISSTPSPP